MTGSRLRWIPNSSLVEPRLHTVWDGAATCRGRDPLWWEEVRYFTQPTDPKEKTQYSENKHLEL